MSLGKMPSKNEKSTREKKERRQANEKKRTSQATQKYSNKFIQNIKSAYITQTQTHTHIKQMNN